MADAAVDNDVLLKGVSYGFLFDLLASTPGSPYAYGVLGSARFVLRKVLSKRPPNRLAQATVELEQALAALEVLEPTNDELGIAAELEYEAQHQQIPVDIGECTLVALLVSRGFNHLLTGDRRAIAGLAALVLPESISNDALAARFICFEQAIRSLAVAKGAHTVRTAVCAEREVDASMRICFSCASPEVPEASWIEGLESQINDLRAKSGMLLAP